MIKCWCDFTNNLCKHHNVHALKAKLFYLVYTLSIVQTFKTCDINVLV